MLKLMVMKLLHFAGIATLSMLGLSCSHGEGNPIERTTDGFPVEAGLECADGQILDIPSIGIMEINIADDILVVSTSDPSNPWQTYSLPDIEQTGSIFTVGGGPGELIMPTPSIIASFYRRESDGHTISIVPSTMNGKFIAGDLTTHRSSDTAINNKIGPMTVMAYRLNDSLWFNTEIIPDLCKVRRSLVAKDGSLIDNAAMSTLNDKSVPNMAQISRIMFRPLIKPDGSWVAEVPGFRPVIDVWNASTGESFQIRYSEDVSGNQQDELSRMGANKMLFGGGVAFDEFFGVLRYDKDGNAHIDFFSWDGDPLATLSTTCSDIRRFVIDLKNGDLYCLDAQQDAVVRFQIGDFLTKLNK
ncbi:MAG: hypothetical protein HDR92_01305 [Bacteroides sp.]|nr:hypothetical protein [Bacteroides sp.]